MLLLKTAAADVARGWVCGWVGGGRAQFQQQVSGFQCNAEANAADIVDTTPPHIGRMMYGRHKFGRFGIHRGFRGGRG